MTEQKKTKPLGELPENWKLVKLEEAVKETKNGFASGKRDENGIVQIRMNNVTTDGRLIFDSYLKVPEPENLDFWLLQKGDFLFNNTNSYDLVGKSAIFTEAPFPCTFSNHFTRIRFKEDMALPEIILYHFLMLWEKGYFKSVAIRHVGQSAVNSKYLLKLKIPLPPLPEQRKIAEILSTVDSAIQQVDESIAKSERLKKGLMQDLLTKGIGHTEFRETEIGRIPEEWEVVRLGDVGKQRKETIIPDGEEESLYVGLEHIEPGKLHLSQIGSSYEVKSAKFRFKERDILYGKLRPYLDKAIISNISGICSTDILVITADERRTVPEFLIYLFHSSRFIKHATTTMTGTNHPRTSWKSISKFKLPRPPLPEQQKIAEILSAVDEKIELEKERKAKLERVKKGLMNDLLTGRKRVKVGEEV